MAIQPSKERSTTHGMYTEYCVKAIATGVNPKEK